MINSAALAIACGLFAGLANAAPPAAFAACAAMKKSDLTWDESTLDAFIADLKKREVKHWPLHPQ